MIRYDLNALEKSTQLAIIQRVNEAGVMHVVTDGVLAIDEAAEETVDVIISAEEANERILSETQKNWNDVANGSKPPNCEICRSTIQSQMKSVGLRQRSKALKFKTVRGANSKTKSRSRTGLASQRSPGCAYSSRFRFVTLAPGTR